MAHYQVLNPSKDIRNLRRQIFTTMKDRRKIKYELGQILKAVIAIEAQIEELRQANYDLAVAAMPNPNEEVPF